MCVACAGVELGAAATSGGASVVSDPAVAWSATCAVETGLAARCSLEAGASLETVADGGLRVRAGVETGARLTVGVETGWSGRTTA